MPDSRHRSLTTGVTVGAGYYNIDAKNVLMTGVRSSVLGTSTYYNNDARIESKGFEANITLNPHHTRDFPLDDRR